MATPLGSVEQERHHVQETSTLPQQSGTLAPSPQQLLPEAAPLSSSAATHEVVTQQAEQGHISPAPIPPEPTQMEVQVMGAQVELPVAAEHPAEEDDLSQHSNQQGATELPRSEQEADMELYNGEDVAGAIPGAVVEHS